MPRRFQLGTYLSRRVYGRLIRLLYPRSHRQRCGAAMEQLFDEQLAELADRGRWALLGLWWTTLSDLAASAWLVRTRGRGPQYLPDFVGDVEIGLRQLSRRPVFAALTIGTLGLGIGASATVHSIVKAVALDPPNLPDPDAVVAVRRVLPTGGQTMFSEHDLAILDREGDELFTSVGGYYGVVYSVAGDDGSSRTARTWQATETLLPLLGIEPVMGRLFRAEDGSPRRAPQVAILSESFWREAFGGASDLVGRRIELDGHTVEVVGIVPDRPRLGTPQVYTALALDPHTDRSRRYLAAYGRRRADIDVATMRRGLAEVAETAGEVDPEASAGWGMAVVPLRDWLYGSSTRRLGHTLLAAVSLLLIMACISVSHLLFVRVIEREREVGVRAILGAGRGRILRQLVTESTLLALFGGALGVAIATIGVPLAQAFGRPTVPRVGDATLLDGFVMWGLGLSLVTVIAFGALPAFYAVRSTFTSRLWPGEMRPASRAHVREGLVVAQTAVSVVILIGAGLMIRSFTRLQAQELGFDPAGVFSVGVLTPNATNESEAVWAFSEVLEERVSAFSGVASVGVTIASPFGTYKPSARFRPRPAEGEEPADLWQVSWRGVTPAYFGAIGLPPLDGTIPDAAERPLDGYGGSIVIDEHVAERFWPGRSPVGEVLQWVGESVIDLEVSGVVGAVRDEEVGGRPPRPRLYWVYGAVPLPLIHVVVRGTDPGTVVDMLSEELDGLGTGLAAGRSLRLTEALGRQYASHRFTAEVLSAFATIALLLAALGIYGVTAHSVRRRFHEFGIRTAMGAEPRTLVAMALRKGVALALAGVLIGVLVAGAVTGLVENALVETAPLDPASFGAVALVMAAVAVVAAWIPAHRVSRFDPSRALHTE